MDRGLRSLRALVSSERLRNAGAVAWTFLLGGLAVVLVIEAWSLSKHARRLGGAAVAAVKAPAASGGYSYGAGASALSLAGPLESLPMVFVLCVVVSAVVVAMVVGHLLRRFAPLPPEDGAGRVDSLDALRGVLSVFVMVHHFGKHWEFESSGWAPLHVALLENLGVCSLNLFYLLSAFLCYRRLIEGGGAIQVPQFALRRAFRIYPVYAFFVVILALMQLQQAHWSFGPAGFKGAARQMGRWLVFDISPESLPPIVGQVKSAAPLFGASAQTLPPLLRFYVMLPLLGVVPFLASRAYPDEVRSGRVRTALLVALLVALRVAPVGPCACAGPFILGAVIYEVFRASGGAEVSGRRLAVSLIAFGVAVSLPVKFRSVALQGTLLQELLLAAFAAPLLWGNHLFGLLSRPSLVYVGRVSYGTFLGHLAIMSVAFHRLKFPHAALGFAALPLVVGAGILFGALCTSAVERPGRVLGALLHGGVAPKVKDDEP